MFDNLYKEEILEHYKNPLNFGRLKDFDTYSRQLNPFCGDEIEIFLKFARKNSIRAIKFFGNGCAVCIAATSMLTEHAKNKTTTELTKFSEKDMLELLGIEVSETRKKCALLGLAVLRDCLK